MLWIYRRCSNTNTISASGRQLLFNLVTPLCPRFPPHTYARLVSLNPVTGDFLRSPFLFRGDPLFLAIILIVKRFILQADIRCSSCSGPIEKRGWNEGTWNRLLMKLFLSGLSSLCRFDEKKEEQEQERRKRVWYSHWMVHGVNWDRTQDRSIN